MAKKMNDVFHGLFARTVNIAKCIIIYLMRGWIMMSNTLTIFKNHEKIYCINEDSAAFSILKCQSIIVPDFMIDNEIAIAEKSGYKYVSSDEFYNEVY